jgi:hypothetical protein
MAGLIIHPLNCNFYTVPKNLALTVFSFNLQTMAKTFKSIVLFLFVCTITSVNAQIGGHGILKFVDLPPSSRAASLGGNLISVKDDDVTLAIQNPSLLNASMDNHLAISYIDYLADINFGSVVFAHSYDSINTGMIGIQYINYGSFIRADEYGNQLGTFTAGEYNLFAGLSRQWKKFSYGGQLKLLYSNLDTYNSYGATIDLSGTYADPDKGFTAAVVFKNMGFQIKPYNEMHEPVPFEIQLGVSEKPKHMPIRISVILTHLETPDITYINTGKPPTLDLATGKPVVETISIGDKIFRHFVFGAEIIISKNFNLRVGYNVERRAELGLPDNMGTVGYSFGAGIRINKFHISYGRSVYSLAGGSNTFTITSNLSEFTQKAKPKQ